MSARFSRFVSRCLNNVGARRRHLFKKGLAKSWRGCRSLESMESRLVPTGELVSFVLSGNANTLITGTIYDDANNNGVRDGGENGLVGWKVYLDLDQSGTLNTDAVGTTEPSALTNIDGDFTLDHLQPGTYRLTELVAAGWTPTAPTFSDVVVINNKEAKRDFLNFGPGSITGTVWNDLNADGVRAKDGVTGLYTDPGLADWTVYLDLNTNLKLDAGEPTTLTNLDGEYTFTNVPPADYEVTVVLPSGWDVSPTFDIHQTASVVSLKVATQDFATFSTTNGSIIGTIWNDMNADGIRGKDAVSGEFTEPGLSGWTVFLDLNVNGKADSGEPTAMTNAVGQYGFVSLAAGDYELTEILPAGWSPAPTFDIKQTVAVVGGKQRVADDFANFTVSNGSIRGVVWNDLNRNGLRDTTLGGVFTDPGLPGWTIYLDLNRNKALDISEPTTITDAAGGYKFADLQVGDYEVMEILPAGWETAPTFGDNQTVTVFSGTESIAHDFANFNLATSVPGIVSGTVWNDLNGNGVREFDPGPGAFTDPGQAGRVIIIDVNANGVLDAGEPNATSAADGSYTITGVTPGTIRIVEVAKAGWQPTAPLSGLRTIALKNGATLSGQDFGSHAIQGSAIHGTVYFDANHDGTRQAGERGLPGITVYLDANNNDKLDAGEINTVTAADKFYTPALNEAGTYEFTHLAEGTYTVRMIVPVTLSATPPAELVHTVTLAFGEDRTGVDCAAVFRDNEIHGIRFDDANGNHKRDVGEDGVGGISIYIDDDRDGKYDVGELTTKTAGDGSFSFTKLAPGSYVVRELETPEYEHTYPETTGGILWPGGVSNPAVGKVSPTSITISLAEGQSFSQSVSLTLPNSGQLTNMVDVFLLFDDTGSFVNNSPIVRAAFPAIISQLQTSLPGIDLGFGVGRFEEYANFASEYSTGRPFVLNQPIVAASTSGYMTAIQAALNRTTPGYGGDQPETDFEALYQLVTGLGFDGNNNGSVLDSGKAGLVATQINPGASGDVPSFASFTADASGSVMTPAGNIGGGGFRTGALPIILLATDTGFAYQPYGELNITGVGGLTMPIGSFTQTSRPTTPFNYGAGIQQTITGLNALGALVIGLGTNSQTNIDPRQGLSAISKLTGAVNHSTTTIVNGTPTPIAPGDPLYFQISSGFAASVANGVVSAIQNGVTNVAVDIDIRASDPRVHIINHTGIKAGVGSGQTATFDVEFIGDGAPRRFDLQFVRAGTDVVLGSIPVVIGTPIEGTCWEYDELEDGEIEIEDTFGGRSLTITPPTKVSNVVINAGATQRSQLSSISVAFDQHVTLPAIPAEAFQLKRQSDGAVVALATAVDDTGTGTVVTLTFTGGAVDGSSLQDGRYDLTIVAATVTSPGGQLDGDGNGTGGDNYQLIGNTTTNKLFRLFGDDNADGSVTAIDFNAFRLAYGLTGPSAFDFNNDGAVTAADFNQFRLRYGLTLVP